MNLSALLLAFFLWPGSSENVRPVELAGEDMRSDWQAHAADATVVATPVVPNYNILTSWRKLGVKVLKRVEYDPLESAEHFRRNIGVLALHEGADGVWLVGREKYPASWQAAFKEAEKDVAAIGHAKALAEKAMGMRDTAHDAWIAGRHVLWALKFFDCEMENLDTLRFEFVCYSRYLEQLMAGAGEKQQAYNSKLGAGQKQQAYNSKLGAGEPSAAPQPPRFEVSKAVGPDRERFTPFEGKEVVAKQVALMAKSDELAPGLAFRHDSDLGFTITSKEKCENGKWPGGGFTLWLYLPGKDGTWLPYEWKIDLSPVADGRAPSDAYGLWFGVERWGKGVLHRYADPKTWRLRPVFRGSAGPEYPHIWPSFRMEWPKEGGWRVNVGFSWLDIYHQWPALETGPRERWYAGVEWRGKTTSVRQQEKTASVRQQEGVYCRIDWPAGRAGNWKTYGAMMSYEHISRGYEERLEKSKGLYDLWYGERLYDFAKVPVATWHRGDTEGDKIFCERVVAPMVDANETIWTLVYSDLNPKQDGKPPHRPKIQNAPEAVQLKVWQNLGKLLDLPYHVSEARRDYLLGRQAGKIPPEPAPKPPKEGAEAVTEPDVDNDDNPLKLDEEAF